MEDKAHWGGEGAKRRYQRLLPGLIFLLATAAYLPSLDNAAVYDDVHLIERDRRVTEAGHLAEFWTGDYWPGSRPSYNYRPLTSTSFALAARLSLNQRAINLTLHGLCAVFVLLILGHLGFGPLPAATAAALFALHPLSSEAIYLIVGRGELLAALFGFALLYCVLRRVPLIVCSLLYAAAIFSKSNAVVVPALALLIYRVANPQQSWRDFLRLSVELALYTIPPLVLLFIARAQVFGMLLTPAGYVDPLFNPLAELHFDMRLLNALWLQLRYLAAFAWPFSLSADHSCCQIELVSSWLSARGALVAIFVAGFGVLLVRTRTRRLPEVAGVAFILLALLPVSNLLFVVGVMFGERLAYLPSLGFAMLGAALLRRGAAWLKPRGRPFGAVPFALAAALAVVYGATIVARDADWQDPKAFCDALVRDAPKSALARSLRFLWHKRRGDLASAERDLRAALAIYPRYYDAWASLAELLAVARDEDSKQQAAAAYVRAAEIVSKRQRDRREAGFFYGKAALLQAKLGRCKAAAESAALARRFVEARHPMFGDLGLWLRACNSSR